MHRARTGGLCYRFWHFVLLWYWHDFLGFVHASFRFIWRFTVGALGVQRSPKYYQQSMMKFATKIGSHEVPLPKQILGLWPGKVHHLRWDTPLPPLPAGTSQYVRRFFVVSFRMILPFQRLNVASKAHTKHTNEIWMS